MTNETDALREIATKHRLGWDAGTAFYPNDSALAALREAYSLGRQEQRKLDAEIARQWDCGIVIATTIEKREP